jgi:hypothetical protein
MKGIDFLGPAPDHITGDVFMKKFVATQLRKIANWIDSPEICGSPTITVNGKIDPDDLRRIMKKEQLTARFRRG